MLWSGLPELNRRTQLGRLAHDHSAKPANDLEVLKEFPQRNRQPMHPRDRWGTLSQQCRWSAASLKGLLANPRHHKGLHPDAAQQEVVGGHEHGALQRKKPADLHRAGFRDTDSDYRIEADFRLICTGLSRTILYGFFRTQLSGHAYAHTTASWGLAQKTVFRLRWQSRLGRRTRVRNCKARR